MLLCYANVMAVWLMGAQARDDATAQVLRESGYKGGTLSVQVNRPMYAPVTCATVEAFFYKWTNPALKQRGLPEARLTVQCGKCTCEGGDICVHL